MAQSVDVVSRIVDEVVGSREWGADMKAEANKGGVNVTFANLKEVGGNDSLKCRVLLEIETALKAEGVENVYLRLQRRKSEQQADGTWKPVGYVSWPHIFVDCRERQADTIADLRAQLKEQGAQMAALLAKLGVEMPGNEAPAQESEGPEFDEPVPF